MMNDQNTWRDRYALSLTCAAVSVALTLSTPAVLAANDVGQAVANGVAQQQSPGEPETEGAQVAEDQVKVRVNDTLTLTFTGPVRLADVLTEAQRQWREHQNQALEIYWPNARLVMRDEQERIDQRQQGVLAQLERLAADFTAQEQPDKARQVENLALQVSSWELGYQPYGTPDFEQSRQRMEYNPLLQASRYDLVLPERRPQVYVYGMSRTTGAQESLTSQTVRGYLQGHLAKDMLLPGYDKNTVHHIEPASTPATVPWAYFNADGEQLMPGDMLWLGPEARWFPTEYRHLATDIPELLTHFVADQSQSRVREEVVDYTHEQVPTRRHWERLDVSPSSSNYGGIGLMQTPTARVQEKGGFTLNFTDMNEVRRYNATFQVFDWLEATAFFARIPNRRYSSSITFSGDNVYTDKGFDMKARVWEESYYLPEIAIGLRDFAGTGLFDGEYVVASKRYGAFDFTLGLGFGRMGTRDEFFNPICEVADRYCERQTGFRRGGGRPEYDQWFTGPASLFGGVEYQTPWDPLTLQLEYDSNDFSKDRLGVDIEPKTPLNVGLNYRPADWLDLSLSFERGDTLTLGVTFRTNLNNLNQIKVEPDRVQPAEPAAESLAEVDWQRASRDLRRQYAYTNARFHTEERADGTKKVTAYGHPHRYRDPNERLDRAARVLAASLPGTVTDYEFVELGALQPLHKVSVDADSFKHRVNYEDVEHKPSETSTLFSSTNAGELPEDSDDGWQYNPERRFGTGFGVKPFLQQDFGNPESFHFYQLGVTGFASRWLNENVQVFGEVGLEIMSNFDRFNWTVDAFDSELPRARTYVREYKENNFWLDRLELRYFDSFSDNVYAQVYGGYLEQMYSGIGGEVLYRDAGSPWAFGANINRVKQRDFDGWLGHRSYEVTTGHASVYYQAPWLDDSYFQLDVGRFLAGDDGVNVTFQKRFDSGVVAGAFAAFTNVSSSTYGEGSFTKGFYINIPFDLMSVLPTRQRIGFSWVPLTRDGGQKLHRSTELYHVTDDKAPFWNR